MISHEIIFPIVFLLILSCFGIYLILRPYRNAKVLIAKWASDNDYKIYKKERKIGFDTGPFVFGGWTAIYKVVIEDQSGIKQTFWTRTGSYLWPFSDNFIVRGSNYSQPNQALNSDG
jgi:hypothetical protein